MNPVVEVHDISKRFPGVVALDRVSLTLRPGRIHALLGENGAGKSTLLGILSGILRPDSGHIQLFGEPVTFHGPRDARRAGIAIVHQEVDLFPDLTVLENMAWNHGLPARFGMIDWLALRQQAFTALDQVQCEVGPDVLAATLSPAQRQLVEIAGAVSASAKVLILDEPTSSLSAVESERLFAHLQRFRQEGTAIVYVSHRLDEVFALADEITVLRDGQHVWHGTPAETSPDQLIRHMVGRQVETTRQRPGLIPGPVRLATRGLTARNGSFRSITLEARAGEILGVYGLIGAGRSDWAQAVFGMVPVASGTVEIDGQQVIPSHAGQMATHGIAYIPEDRLRQGLCRSLSVRINSVLASLEQLAPLGWLSGRAERELANHVTRQLEVRLTSLEQPIGTLSGGNQQKVVVGRWLAREPKVLILDEPTRGVDVGAREEIYALVHRAASEGQAIVLISSDLAEVMHQSDRIAVFCQGQLAGTFPGDTPAEAIAAVALPAGTRNARRSSRQVNRVLDRVSSLALPGFLVVFFLLIHARTGQFLTLDNLRGLAIETTLLSFCALAAMLVLLVGGLDISLGAMMALSAAIAGSLWEQGVPFPLVVLTALCVGGLAGFLNAGLSLVGRVHPIVVTLGTMSVYRGLTQWWLRGDVHIDSPRRAWLTAEFASLPLLVWLGLALSLGLAFVLRFTRAGRMLFALGSNPAAARRAGIDRARIWLGAFAAQGMLVGLAGLLYLARSGHLQSTSHEGRTLEAIAAAVVGGVAITGGSGKVWRVLLGCLLLVSVAPACVFVGLAARWQTALVGMVLIVAVSLDALLRRRSA